MLELISLRDGEPVPAGDAPFRFPAGEQHTVANAPADEVGLLAIVRGTDAEDFVAAAMWTDLWRRRGVRVDLAVPYLPGARQDRGEPFGAEVYAQLVALVGARRVHALDPHSPVMPGLIPGLRQVPFARFVRDRLAHTSETHEGHDYVGVIAPDAGALARATAVARALEVPVLQARKHRDFATGALSGFSCDPLPDAGRLLVVDDICDGGGTFLGLADATGLGPDRLDLWVTHAPFTAGAERLAGRYGRIHTTDSHPGCANPAVAATVHPLTATLVQEALR